MLADWAAIAITNSRLYRAVRERRDELERTIRGLETTTEISRALGGVTDLDRVLELVVKRSRALVGARAAEIALLEGDEFVIAAVAGEGVERPARDADLDRRVARGRGAEVRSPAARPGDPAGHVRLSRAGRPLGARDADVVPEPPGRLPDRLRPAARRPAVQRGGRAPAGGVRRERRDRGGHRAARGRRGAAPQHRGVRAGAQPLGARVARRDAAAARRPARAALGGAAQRRPDRIDTAIGEAIEHLKTEHRGPALADHGSAARGARRVRHQGRRSRRWSRAWPGSPISPSSSRSTSPRGRREADSRHSPEIESTVYRVVQEALTNAVKHAEATRVQVRVSDRARRRRRDRSATTARASTLQELGPASACSACASGWRWSAGRSRSSPRRARGRRSHASHPRRVMP